MKNFGTARLERNTWLLRVEPHVAIRVKRIFSRIREESLGTLELGDSPEVCDELLWFCERYPLEVTPREYAEREAAKFRERERSFSELLEGRIDPRPFELAIPPREYQAQAAELALRSRGLLLGDDLGLGKTASSIAVLTDPDTRPALVVTLPHLCEQWAREFRKFAPELSVHVAKKGTPYALGPEGGQQSFTEDAFPDVLVLNYHKLAGWAQALLPIVKTVIFDECQELRRPDSGKAQAARLLGESCAYRMGLSATPVYNYGSEIHSIYQALAPEALGSRTEFLREWCGGVGYDGKGRVKDPVALGTYLRSRGLYLRRNRKDVGRELDPVTTVYHEVQPRGGEVAKLKSNAAELARLILNRAAAFNERGSAARELDWRMRQATGIEKAPEVAGLVRMLVEQGEKVVLYGWHRAVYDLWMSELEGLRPRLYTGSESSVEKQRAAQDFIRGGCQVLIMSLRAGAGLDGLQEASSTVVFGELDWSPGVHEQCVGRVLRDGQDSPVFVYYVLSDSGSDPVVSEVLGVKRGQVQGFKDPDGVTRGETDMAGQRVKMLARSVLEACGEAVEPDDQLSTDEELAAAIGALETLSERHDETQLPLTVS